MPQVNVGSAANDNTGELGPRAWLQKINQSMQDCFNVQSYGAKGNGIADDGTAINAALSAANAAGGGIVFFPPGTYSVGQTLTLYSAVHLIGAGITATILQLRTGTNADLCQSQNFSMLTLGNTAGGIHSWSLRDLTLDGNKGSQSGTSYCLRVYGFGYELLDCRIRNGLTGGVWSEWQNGVADVNPDAMEAFWLNVKVHDCGGTGVLWNGPHDSVWTNVIVYRNSVTTPGANPGIDVTTNGFAGSGGGLHLTKTHVYSANHNFCLRTADLIYGVDCFFENATTAGVTFNAGSGGSSLTGGTFQNALPVGIIYGTSDCICVGAQFKSCTTAAVQINTGVLSTVTIGKFIGCAAVVNFSGGDSGRHVIEGTVFQSSGANWWTGSSPNSTDFVLLTSTPGSFQSWYQFGGHMLDLQSPLVSGVAPAVDASLGNYFTLTILTNIAVVIGVPTNFPINNSTQEIVIAIRNGSGGALATGPTFNTGANGFKFTAGQIVNPANGTQVLYKWRWDPVQGFWYLIGVSPGGAN